MNSKVIGIMLILGPILTMGIWILYSVDTEVLSPSDAMIAILAENNKTQIGSILQIFGSISMFTGLYLLAKSLKSDNSVSNHFAEIGGLLLLLSVPIWVVMIGSPITAIETAEEFGNDVGATIIASSTAFEMVGFLMIIGLFMLGISLTLLRKYKGIVGILFIITSVCGFIDMLISNEIISIIGWMGMFLMTFVTGILITLKKEN
jgi:hypothetical protein